MLVDQRGGRIHEHSVDDFAAAGHGKGPGQSCRAHGSAVSDGCMAVDPLQPHRPVLHRGVEVGASRELLVRPQLLVPATPGDPRQVRIGGGIIAQPLLQFGQAAGAGQVQLPKRQAMAHYMPMRVDQAGHQHPPAAVHHARARRQLQLLALQHPLHLAVITDQQTGETLDLPVGSGANALHIGDQHVGKGGLGGEQGKRGAKEKLLHAATPSIVGRRGKG